MSLLSFPSGFEYFHTSFLWAATLWSLIVAGILTHLTYNVFLHPLRSFPGPKSWAASRLPWHRKNMSGELAYALQQIHQKYGPIVRIGPDELSFIPTGVDIWKTIYAHRPKEMPKSLLGHGLPPPPSGAAHGIITADEENHFRIRRAVAPAFSERALRNQEGFLNLYNSKLVARIRERASHGPQDLAKLFNFTTFDIIGDLAFGESFGGLDSAQYHPWVATITGHIRAVSSIQFILYYRLGWLMAFLMPKKAKEARAKHFQLSRNKVNNRLERQENRKDFISYITQSGDVSAPLSEMELQTTCSTFIVAGSETSATMLAGITFLFLSHPEVYQALSGEIRATFLHEADINMVSVNQLRYLTMVMHETLRFYPPSPATTPRIVPASGERIGGRWVPGGTVVGINQWSTYRSEINFYDANRFDPDRWLDPDKRPSQYAKDNRDCLQPFSYGPRNCIGMNLANVEIRLIISRLLWNFDLELCPESKTWPDQKVFLTWEKKPLMVKLRLRGGQEASGNESTSGIL